jgi:hypothetical protein
MQRSKQKQMSLLAALVRQFPQLGLAEASFRVIKDDADGISFDDPVAGVSGHVDAPQQGYWGHTVRVVLAATGKAEFLGLLSGEVPYDNSICDLHQNIPMKADRFVFTHPEEHRATLRSITPNVDTIITFLRPNMDNSCINISVPGIKDRTIVAKPKVKQFNSRMSEAVSRHDHLNLFNNGIIANTLNLTVNRAAEEDRRPFIKLRDMVLDHAREGRLYKLGGHVWRPVLDCPCAYTMAENFRDFLNVTLNDEEAYHERPSIQRELIEYLTNYNPDAMSDVIFSRGMLAFTNGVLDASLDCPEVSFVPYDTMAPDSPMRARVARHYIAKAFDPAALAGGVATPLFDKVVGAQFSPAVARTLLIMLGRALFPIGTHDNWQVIAWLVGTAGTGKSLVLELVAAGFPISLTGTLSGNNEHTFGLDGKYTWMHSRAARARPATRDEQGAHAGDAAVHGQRRARQRPAQEPAGGERPLGRAHGLCEQHAARLRRQQRPDRQATRALHVSPPGHLARPDAALTNAGHRAARHHRQGHDSLPRGRQGARKRRVLDVVPCRAARRTERGRSRHQLRQEVPRARTRRRRGRHRLRRARVHSEGRCHMHFDQGHQGRIQGVHEAAPPRSQDD